MLIMITEKSNKKWKSCEMPNDIKLLNWKKSVEDSNLKTLISKF